MQLSSNNDAEVVMGPHGGLEFKDWTPRELTARACGICGVRDIPLGVDWPAWREGRPVHLPCIGVPVRRSVTAPVSDPSWQTTAAPEHIDGYWDDEFERQWHYEVKGG